MLYEKAINEGNKVYFDKDNKLEKELYHKDCGYRVFCEHDAGRKVWKSEGLECCSDEE